MNLQDLGYNNHWETTHQESDLQTFDLGRVTLEHKERYIVKTAEKEYEAELLGNLRFTATSRSDFPAVGDWVGISPYDEGKALIHGVLPRKSCIERKAVGKSEAQIIAANIDYGLIVQSVNRDFNLNRLERYITLCYAAKVQPVIVLSKIDLIEAEELARIKEQITQRIQEVAVACVSVNREHGGYEEVKSKMEKGKTYCLLGSSGVGKSTLLNALSGEELMKTGAISTAVNKGKHVTSHRELIVLEAGGILIDNPGMREVGLADVGAGLEQTFDQIYDLAKECRYPDCTHMHETGCAVIEAVESGHIDAGAYANFQKMEKERLHFESDALERRQKDRAFGKMVRNVKKIDKRKRF